MHIIGSRQPGGAEGFFVRLVQALNEAGHEASAIVPPGSAVAVALGETVRQWPIKMRGHWDLIARHQIQARIDRQAPDIVMTYLGRAARLVRLPSGRLPVHVARLGGYYDLRQYQHAHAWVGNTRGICDYMIGSGLPPSRVEHIPNFVDIAAPPALKEVARVREELQLRPGHQVVLALGRLHQVKGFDTLIRAFAAMTAASETILVVLGEGAERSRLEDLSRDLDVADRVRLPGWRNELSPYFAAADLFVCPSRLEPFGNVLLDAWSHGVPLLATRTAGASELVADGDNGLLVDIEDVDAMSSTMTTMLSMSDSDRQRMIESGRATIAGYYSRNAVVTHYLEYFDRLIR
jgi:glycosyltransferase involved in cell wall biosynthesis